MRVAIGLGSSLGDRRAQLELAVRRLAAHPGLTLLRVSRWYRTPPMRGGTARNPFLNGVALFECTLSLEELLTHCVCIEELAGRRRGSHWGDRTLDLDVLLADDCVVARPELRVPHPGIADRSFVIVPLLEVWPDATDPRTGLRWADSSHSATPRPVPAGVLALRRVAS